MSKTDLRATTQRASRIYRLCTCGETAHDRRIDHYACRNCGARITIVSRDVRGASIEAVTIRHASPITGTEGTIGYRVRATSARGVEYEATVGSKGGVAICVGLRRFGATPRSGRSRMAPAVSAAAEVYVDGLVAAARAQTEAA